ncbi:hypothetical protein PsYK624_146590 [Phanerochaete sordida]|uniref:Uncharacterized protein n=1 Tax=Phanerochaete sordida TaxID=48140 RepID=A0A9P3GQD2_9APHY|nr:hypothetical protein PsYK624_146590 [Phanerochaete sordida]
MRPGRCEYVVRKVRHDCVANVGARRRQSCGNSNTFVSQALGGSAAAPLGGALPRATVLRELYRRVCPSGAPPRHLEQQLLRRSALDPFSGHGCVSQRLVHALSTPVYLAGSLWEGICNVSGFSARAVFFPVANAGCPPDGGVRSMGCLASSRLAKLRWLY